MKATQPSPKQRSDDERGGREEGSGCASRPHAEPSPRAQGESTPAPPAESRGAGRSLHLLPPRGRAERVRETRAPGRDAGLRPLPGRAGGQRPSGTLRPRRGPQTQPCPSGPRAHTDPRTLGPERPAGRGPDHRRGAPAGAGAGLAALGGGGASLPRGPRAWRGRRQHSPARLPLRAATAAPHSGRDPPSASTKPQAAAVAAAAAGREGRDGCLRLPRRHGPTRLRPPRAPPPGRRRRRPLARGSDAWARPRPAAPNRSSRVPPSHWACWLLGPSGWLGPRQLPGHNWLGRAHARALIGGQESPAPAPRAQVPLACSVAPEFPLSLGGRDRRDGPLAGSSSGTQRPPTRREGLGGDWRLFPCLRALLSSDWLTGVPPVAYFPSPTQRNDVASPTFRAQDGCSRQGETSLRGLPEARGE